MSGPLVSIVTPVFNEAENLPELCVRLQRCLDANGIRWEWLAVDDGSTDDSAEVLRRLASAEPRLRVIALDGNRGSHAAIFRGLREARGDAVVSLASDLQDPPEIIPRLLGAWRDGGAALVWAARTKPAGATVWDRFLSASYHGAVRIWTGLPAPRFGADCFLADRSVLDQLARWDDFGRSIFLRLLSLRVPQRSVPHDRQPRRHGVPGWTAMAKTQLAVSSLLAFTSPKSWMRRVRNFFRRTGQSVAAPGAARAITRLVRGWLDKHLVSGPHLDVGCGARSRLGAAGLQAHGVDSDERSVATFNSDGGCAVVASSTALPFHADKFGAVWSFGLLHHLDDAELEKSLGEMERVVMPGGWILVFDAVLPRSGWRRPLAAIVRVLDKGRHMRTEERLRAVLAAHGEWECRRVTYSWNGLEALFCSHHKPSEQTPPAPCPSPPTSS